MSRRRAKTPGWAAFDPKKKHNQVTDNLTQNDPYPPISTNNTTLHHCQNPSRNGNLTKKSFSSVLIHSTSVPNIVSNEDTHSPLNVSNFQNVPNLMGNSQSEKNISQIYEKLKKLYPWANENLIEDIVAAVDNDIDKASSLLREMAPCGRLQDKKEAEFEDHIEEVCVDDSMQENMGLHGKVLLDDDVQLRLMMDSLSMVPMEPEWEDDDMYLMHRKEAIRAMRLASRHSKAATEAYLRRDHAAAQEFSLKAREEWSNAEKLNAKAAKEILAIRNCENDDYKLDLHGLHAAEAVQVLSNHLLKIESQVLGTQSTFSRPRLLEVITGKGSHSRGEAALPVAIKNFLSEKGYYYYEARIGVITVQPKFRQLSTAILNTQ